ncbi:hypothetical protein BY458DRAFT_516881 [Sporodiniella umbellata]|nr:hypothetical protein BY458DRAFT_516881 [Sporodiniella umbellata]
MSALRLLNFSKTAAKPLQWIRPFATKSTDSFTAVAETPAMPSVVSSGLLQAKELSTSLDPYVGRSIANVQNPLLSYRRLGSILAQNKVRKELRANVRYEKPNVTRRRKDIERNRRLFGAMISKKVALIMQMKQRGM